MAEGTADRSAYYRWQNMMRRCFDATNKSYPDYGGRGITVCERWRLFEGYRADVGEPPEPGMSLDRIDNDGDYEPGNVRWASRAQQSRNRRRSAYGAETSRTHCPAGHAYDEANTYRHGGHRYCRRCNADQKARRRAQKEAATRQVGG